MPCDYCGLSLPHNVFLAPMAGVTTRPFRSIALAWDCALAWTEMISSEGLVRGDRRTRGYLPRGGEGGPVAVQIFGHRPEVLREAALIAEQTPAEIIDINMGCPVRKVVREGSGAALMRDPVRVRRILTAVCREVKKPVTVKIRSGWDERSRNAVVIARIAEDSGASAVTVHGRTARQGFGGRADWGAVAAVAGAVRIPVVGSGDLTGAQDVEGALARSGCAAVMIGRAALGRPWIFRQIMTGREGRRTEPPAVQEVGAAMLRHLELNLAEFGERMGVILTRRPLSWYSRGYPGAGEFRRRINTMMTCLEVQREIRAFSGLVSEEQPLLRSRFPREERHRG